MREMAKLVKLIEGSSYLVIHTGAGISTSCGIRDFRGPNGVWTREKQGLGLALLPTDVAFEEASPSFTHMAILALVQQKKCKYVISQNVDGLHLRSGLPRTHLSELHGNIFHERCPQCRLRYLRNFDVGGCGFGATSRVCAECGGPLYDLTLDWEDALPERDFMLARRHTRRADVSVALGTSMRVHPAATIPLLTVDKSGAKHSALSNVDIPEDEERQKNEEEVESEDEDDRDVDGGLAQHVDVVELSLKQRRELRKKDGRLAIINLQPTPHDREAHCRLHQRCDDVMRELMRRLRIPVPDYVRSEEYVCRVWPHQGVLTISTDTYIFACVFGRLVHIRYTEPNDGNNVEVKLEPSSSPNNNNNGDVPSTAKFVWNCQHLLHTDTLLRIEVELNNHATTRVVRLEHRMNGPEESRWKAEVVRVAHPIGNVDDPDDAWLSRNSQSRPSNSAHTQTSNSDNQSEAEPRLKKEKKG